MGTARRGLKVLFSPPVWVTLWVGVAIGLEAAGVQKPNRSFEIFLLVVVWFVVTAEAAIRYLDRQAKKK